MGGELVDGEVIDAAGLKIKVMATPGHTADSLSFLLDDAVLTADTVLGRGTTVIDNEDGSLADYLESLRRLAAWAVAPCCPGTGPICPDLEAVASGYLAHRRANGWTRCAPRCGTLATMPLPARSSNTSTSTLTRKFWDAAEWSVQAQLDYLRQ